MIVCSCHAVSDAALRDAAAAGLSLGDVEERLGAGTDCGCCRPAVVELVERAAAAPRSPCRGADACPGCPHRRAAA